MGKWADEARELETLLRLRTFPLAWRRVKTVAEMEKIPRVRRLDHPVTFCQMLTLARTAGWTVGLTAKDFPRCGFKSVAGLVPPTEEDLSGIRRAGYWLKTPEDARKQMTSMCRIPADGYEAMVLAPLAAERFEPEVVIVYGNPAQLMMLCCGYQWTDYERLTFHFIGETACSDSIAQCYRSGKPALTLPCYGERRLGHAQDDELIIALPPAAVARTLEGLRGLFKVGLRYPIPYFGAEADASPTLERAYGEEALKARKESLSR